MKSIQCLAVILANLFLQSACAVPPKKTMSPAVLHHSTPEITQQLTQAISRALNVNSASLNLAPDVFTQSSQLRIEKNTQPPPMRPELSGRLMQAPVVHHFTLMKRADECYLVYEKTGESQRLDGLSCR